MPESEQAFVSAISTNETAPELLATSGKPKTREVLDATALADRYLDAVHAFISRRLADRQAAEDLTLETMQDAFQGLARLKGDPLPWLYGIARRKLANAMRRQRIRQEANLDLAANVLSKEADCPETVAIRREMIRSLHVLIAELPDPQREVLLLQQLEELPIADIAKVIGKSEAAANSLLQRARTTLQRRATEQGIEFNEVNR